MKFPQLPEDELRKRLYSKVEKREGCWKWNGWIHKFGYSKLSIRNPITGTQKHWMAHRLIWELENGLVSNGMCLDHLCRNRACVNPSHLEIVTPRENTLRGESLAAKEHRQSNCIHGHPLSGNNLYLYRDRKRICKRCGYIRLKEWRRKNASLPTKMD